MIELEISELKERKNELTTTLKNLCELIYMRNNVLWCFEKNDYNKTFTQFFSNLNTTSRGLQMSKLMLMKKTHQLDLKLLRRGQFYLNKRKRRLELELEEISDKINNLEKE